MAGCVGLATTKSQGASAGFLSPSALTFAAQPVHTKSSPQSVTLTNTGNAPMNISAIVASGDFSQTNNCPVVLSVGASCTAHVAFAPTASGTRIGAITVSDNTSSNPHSVALTGIGSNVASTISLAPVALDFGAISSGSASASQSITVTNSGASNLALTDIIVSSNFSISGIPAVPATLLPGQATSINVAFAPAAGAPAGAITGSLKVLSDSSTGPAVVPLRGTVTSPTTSAPAIMVNPTSLDFGKQNIGSTTSVQPLKDVTVQNTGTANLTVSAIASSDADFPVVGAPALPMTIAPGNSARFGVAFAPVTAGVLSGTLTITSNAPSSPNAVSLAGVAVAASTQLSVNPSSLSFGNLNLGATSPAQTITLKNTGSSSVSISAIAASPAQFAAAAQPASPMTLAAGESASVNVTFAPAAAGALSGTLIISSNASSSPDSISLFGTGTRPSDSGALDSYGGTTALACPGGPKPHFYTQKIANRWWLCTPAGNVFWLRSIYHVDGNDSSADYQGVVLSGTIQQKYGSLPTWGSTTVKRMQSWGFNATAEYSSGYVQPVTTNSNWSTPDHTNPEKMPFIGLIWPSHYARIANSYAATVKDLVGATNSNYKGLRHACLDVFDPNFGQWLQKKLRDPSSSEYRWIHSSHSDYLIGINVDDPDELFGFGAGPDFRGFSNGTPDDFTHAHLGLIALVTPSAQSSGTDGSGRPISYSDTTVYTKQAFSDWVSARYNGNLNLLNQAWGSSYTSFGSDGGWPNGNGLLDEDGRHSWVPRDSSKLTDASAALKKDLDDFLVTFARKYFSTIKGVLQAEAPGILYLGPTNMGGWGAPARKEILQGGAPYLDAIMLSTIPTQCVSCTDDQQRMDFVTQYGGDKPWINWEAISAPPDSYMSVFPVTQVSTPYATTQGLRGQQFQKMVSDMLWAKDSAGTYHIVGYKWWQYYDSRGEQANWGFVTPRDNPYDGVSAVISAGSDQFGYPTGGERANYGDFVSAAKAANLNVYKSLLNLP